MPTDIDRIEAENAPYSVALAVLMIACAMLGAAWHQEHLNRANICPKVDGKFIARSFYSDQSGRLVCEYVSTTYAAHVTRWTLQDGQLVAMQ